MNAKLDYSMTCDFFKQDYANFHVNVNKLQLHMTQPLFNNNAHEHNYCNFIVKKFPQ